MIRRFFYDIIQSTLSTSLLKNRKPESFIKQPTYPGGVDELNKFITSNLKYPQEAIDNNIQGTVSVDFDIDVFGKIILTKIKHGIGYGCDEEAVRLVKLLQFSKRKYQGVHVIFHRNLNINFKLNTATKLPDPEKTQSFVINYTTTPSPNSLTPPNPPTSNVINIQINLDPEPTKE